MQALQARMPGQSPLVQNELHRIDKGCVSCWAGRSAVQSADAGREVRKASVGSSNLRGLSSALPFWEIPATFFLLCLNISCTPVVAVLYLMAGKGFVSLLRPHRACGSSALSNLTGQRAAHARSGKTAPLSTNGMKWIAITLFSFCDLRTISSQTIDSKRA
jgi:hypothetical protein